MGHLLAYNLIRTAMAQVASSAGRRPRELSVAGTVQALAALVAEVLGTAAGYAAFVRVVLANRVGNRPDRVEPRARKRRPKPLPTTRRPTRRCPKTAHGITMTLQEVPFGLTRSGISHLQMSRHLAPPEPLRRTGADNTGDGL